MKAINKLLFVLLLGIGPWLFAQPRELRKAVRDREGMERDVYFQALRAVQKENPQSGMVYYALGELEYGDFLAVDPVLQRVAAKQYLLNAKTNYGLAKNFMKEDELIEELFANESELNKDSPFTAYKKVVDNKLVTTEQTLRIFDDLMYNYDRAVKNYLICRQQFIDLNARSENLRQFFLESDESVKRSVATIGTHFDSTLTYLEKYQKLYLQMPYANKQPGKVKLEEIYHFRMNGMTPSNFLTETIVLWDYKSWSERFLGLIKEEVEGLRVEIESAFQYFTETSDKLLNTNECVTADIEAYKPQRIQNLVTKYDASSPLVHLIGYLSLKTSFANTLGYDKNCNEYNSQSNDDLLSRRVRVMQNVHTELEKSDSVAQLLRNASGSTDSFQWFFDKYFSGSSTYPSFTEAQVSDGHSAFRRELNKIKSQHLNVPQPADMVSCYALRNGGLFVSSEGNSCIEMTLHTGKNTALAVVKTPNSYELMYLSAAGDGYDIEWQKPVPGKKIEFAKIVTDSLVVIGGHTGGGWLNLYDLNGTKKQDFNITGVPIQDVFYNDLLQTLTVLQVTNATNRQYRIGKYALSGKSSGSQSFTLTGQLVSTAIYEGSFWFFNHAASGNEMRADVMNVEKLSWEKDITYALSQPIYTPVVIRNDNVNLTLIGHPSADSDQVVYALIDYEGNIEDETIY